MDGDSFKSRKLHVARQRLQDLADVLELDDNRPAEDDTSNEDVFQSISAIHHVQAIITDDDNSTDTLMDDLMEDIELIKKKFTFTLKKPASSKTKGGASVEAERPVTRSRRLKAAR